MATVVIGYANILSAYCILLSALLIIRQNGLVSRIAPILFFLVCVFIYLVIDFFPRGTIYTVLVAGPFLLSFSFWLASKSLFSDKSIPLLKNLLIGTFLLLVYYALYYVYQLGSFSSMTSLISRTISLSFVILVVYEAQKDKENDLISKRKQLRNIFTYSISIIVLLSLLAELGLSETGQEAPKLVQRVSILIFSSYFLLQNSSWKDFFHVNKTKSIEIKDHELIDRIQQKISEECFYRSEGLTIGKLAESLNEQEYIIRQAINQQLGYRNFTDFLNSYRITEAKKILADHTERKVTVLEIAYKIGFNSIGPFNRAFKMNTGLTPTDYRKSHLSNS